MTIQSALFIADNDSLRGPEGNKKPLPIHWLELKQIKEKFLFIEKSWKPSSKIATSWFLVIRFSIASTLFFETKVGPTFLSILISS